MGRSGLEQGREEGFRVGAEEERGEGKRTTTVSAANNSDGGVV